MKLYLKIILIVVGSLVALPGLLLAGIAIYRWLLLTDAL